MITTATESLGPVIEELKEEYKGKDYDYVVFLKVALPI